MDYLEFYGLEEEPFSQAPNLKFFYNSPQHSRAMLRLMYAVDTMKGLAVLLGEIGTGKTILARRMLDNLPEEEYESALLVIIHSQITADWLLNRIARQLGIESPAPEKLKLLNQLYNRLIELYEKGKKAVVLVDEAQMLRSREIMEEFRGLLNLEMEGKLITFVFFGLPELEEHLHLDEPLAQRIAVKCRLESFNRESTEGYINHRLRMAGAKTQLFSKSAIDLVHTYSRGIPRLINTICDNCLFEGYLLKQKTIDENLVNIIATDLGLSLKKKKGKAPSPKPSREVEPSVPEESTEIELEQAMARAGLKEEKAEETIELEQAKPEEKAQETKPAEEQESAPPSEEDKEIEDLLGELDEN